MAFPLLLPLAIGAGAGALSSLFGPRQQTSTQTTTLDPRTQAALDAFRRNAGDVYGRFAGASASPYAFAGQTGLGGIEQYFNPFQQNVIGGLQSDFDRQRALSGRAADAEATSAGAFGGSRAAVLRALGQRDIGQQEAQTLGQFRYQGYGDALNQLLAERQRQFGMGQQFDANMFNALALQQGGLGFGGQTTTSAQPIYRNPIAGALGGMSTVAGLLGPNAFGGGGGPTSFAPTSRAPLQFPQFGSGGFGGYSGFGGSRGFGGR